jgi:phospholipid/cholesterol/gamma-HCH transport system substrate-binding protein
MEYRSSEVKAGMFIFVSLIVLAGMIFMLGNLQDFIKPKRPLRITFNYTGGLEIGSPVRYAGLAIGRVVNIELSGPNDKINPERIIVVTGIDPAIQIRKNSTAMIKTSGLMGGLYIDIRPGTGKAGLLGEDEPLLGQESFEFAKVGDIMTEFVRQIERFTDIADTLATDSKATLTTLQTSLSNINQVINENRHNIHSNLSNMTKISGELANLMDKNDGEFRQTLLHISSLAQKTDILLTAKEGSISNIIDQTQKVTRELELLLADNRPGLTSLVRTMETDSQKIAGKIDSVAGNLDQTFQQTNSVLVENRRNLLELIKNLRETSETLKEFSDDIKRNPWKLVRKSDEPSGIDQGKPAPAVNQDALKMKRLDKIAVKP